MLTPEQIDTLQALVRKERQFWNDLEDEADARRHGRDEASLNTLHDALERLRTAA